MTALATTHVYVIVVLFILAAFVLVLLVLEFLLDPWVRAQIRRLLGRPSYEDFTMTSNTYTLESKDHSSMPPVTLDYLEKAVIPYLREIATLQNVINDVRARDTYVLTIERIVARGEAVYVDLKGVAEAVQLVENRIVPWTDQHSYRTERLRETYELVESIKPGRSGSRTINPHDSQTHAVLFDTSELARDIAEDIDPTLPETERRRCRRNLVPAIIRLVHSSITIRAEPH